MVSKEEALPISRQCQLLDVGRSTYYYVPEPVSDEELALMKLLGWYTAYQGLVI